MTFNPQLIWFLIGLGMILSEFFLPGIILVFFGLGAWTAAITSWLGITSGWTSQLLVFAVSSVLYLVLLRRWFQAKFIGFEGDPQNPQNNLDDFQGQIVIVTEDIDPAKGPGRVEFKGAGWAARSEEPIAAGQRARVIGVESITLLVEPA
jgi:membrane protein implicated in regulation of membrane protease activity